VVPNDDDDDDGDELIDVHELNNDRGAEADLIEDLQEELDTLSSHGKATIDQIQPMMPASHTKTSPRSKQCNW
jgi:hypothetical protein